MPPIMQQIYARKELVRILGDHGLALPYDASKLVFTDRGVYEPSGSRLLSDCILDHDFPKIDAAEVLHFTRHEVLESVLSHKSIWLASLTKRFDEGEYKTFLDDQNLASAGSDDIRKDLASNYYYASFTPVGSVSVDDHWAVFARTNGFCLHFDLKPLRADLRRIRYRSSAPTLFKSLSDAVRDAIGLPFLPWGVARIAAFALEQNLSYEDEMRLLLPNPARQTIFKHDSNTYVAVPLHFGNPICDVRLQAITCAGSQDMPTARSLLRRYGFDHVPVYHRVTNRGV